MCFACGCCTCACRMVIRLWCLRLETDTPGSGWLCLRWRASMSTPRIQWVANFSLSLSLSYLCSSSAWLVHGTLLVAWFVRVGCCAHICSLRVRVNHALIPLPLAFCFFVYVTYIWLFSCFMLNSKVSFKVMGGRFFDLRWQNLSKYFKVNPGLWIRMRWD